MKRNLIKTFLLTVVMAMPLAAHSQNGYEIHKKNGEIDKIQYNLIDSIVCKQEADIPLVIDSIDITSDLGKVVCKIKSQSDQIFSYTIVEKQILQQKYDELKLYYTYVDLPLAIQSYIKEYCTSERGADNIVFEANSQIVHPWYLFAYYPGTSYYVMFQQTDDFYSNVFIGEPVFKEFRAPITKMSDKKFTITTDEPVTTYPHVVCTPPEGSPYYWMFIYEKVYYDEYIKELGEEAFGEMLRSQQQPYSNAIDFNVSLSEGSTYTMIMMGVDAEYLPIYQTYDIVVPGAVTKKAIMAPISKDNLENGLVKPMLKRDLGTFQKPDIKTNFNLK